MTSFALFQASGGMLMVVGLVPLLFPLPPLIVSSAPVVCSAPVIGSMTAHGNVLGVCCCCSSHGWLSRHHDLVKSFGLVMQ
jgi:hypothetical protein